MPVLLLFAATLLLYAGSLHYPLVFDDVALQERNMPMFGRMWQDLAMRWVTFTTFYWTHELVAMNLAWHRLVNVILHALTVITLFALLRRLYGTVLRTTSPALESNAGAADLSPVQLAFLGALIFALHPISVYGVAYLVERSIVMATLFSLLALFAWTEGMLGGKRQWLFASCALYFLAVFSKEHCVMLPGVAMALTLLLRKPSWSLVRELRLPLLLFAAIGAFVILRAKGVIGAAYEPFATEAVAHLASVDASGIYVLSVITECAFFFKYLFLWIVPSPAWLAVDLREPIATGILSWPETAGAVAFVLYFLFAAWLLLKGGRRGLAGFFLLFPWLFYLTELSTVRIQEPFVLYRSYLWMGGLAALVPLLLPSANPKWKFAAPGLICLCLLPLTLDRLDSFSTEWKLWNDVVAKNPDRTRFFAERGYNKRGIASIRLGNYSDAIADFTTSLEIYGKDPLIFLNRGMARMQSGDYPDALEDFARGLELDPREAGFHVNRGIIFASTKRYAEALAEFDRALELKSGDAVAHFNRGLALRLMGRYDEGTASIRKGCELGHAPACKALDASR
jgi:hypothetical protein